MQIFITPTFSRHSKKLVPRTKKALDDAVRAIASDPTIGEAKTGDLNGVFVYKYYVDTQEWLVAYTFVPGVSIKLLLVGSHENFYRTLKRSPK
jgi:mRNA-degrading endonuclease RelE of RelBE toxin-antitoxin system